MIDLAIVESIRESAAVFCTQTFNNPQTCGLAQSEKHWMEELSKIYLTAELDITVPDSPTPEFSERLAKASAFGQGSAVITRLILALSAIVCEKDFFTNTPSYMTILERHQEHWSQQFLEIQHSNTGKRGIENFMHDYFNAPESVKPEELTFFLTLYFKHFYRLLYQFMLFYTKEQSTLYYGRANP